MLIPLASFLPPAASSSAAMVDKLFLFILFMSIFFFAGIVMGLAYFLIRYRRKVKNPGLVHGPTHNTALEIVWSVIPGILCIIIFFWGFHVYMKLLMAPSDAMEVQVRASKWNWEFTYDSGAISSDLVVPVDRPVRLVMHSKDVIHSLFIPDFRVKMDVVPYRYSSLWFESTRIDTYDLFCAEYCGQQHSTMHASVKVVSEADFEVWLEENSKPPTGEKLYTIKGCAACHSVDGTASTGPTWQGLYGTERVVIEGGKEVTVIADENYLRKSILQPMAQIVKNYQPLMPPNDVTSEDLDSLINYIKRLSQDNTTDGN